MQPARQIIDKCGGAQATAELAECTVNYVYRWVTPIDSGGLGGRVPERARRRLLAASKRGCLELSPADFEPGWGRE